MNIEAKTVDDSRVETVHIVRPNHLNGANRLFGGILMQWIDEVAGIVAKRHSMCNVTTASVDNLTFLHGAYQNEMVVIKGKMTWVGSSSMEVCVDTDVENHLGERDRINNAHFMMVALDENDKPQPEKGRQTGRHLKIVKTAITVGMAVSFYHNTGLGVTFMTSRW